ncbi:MAG: hypothetical protein KC635_17525, partial [Myxococcales bacterium]|nr:hypothetical protein [Myxococcales bacterium]
GCADPRYLMRARVGDGEPVFLRGVEVTAESARRRGASVLGATPDVATTTRFVLDAVAFGDPAKGKVGWDDDNEGIRAWNTLLVPRLAEGDNVVHVTVTGDCGLRDDGPSPVLAEGTLRVTVAPGAKAAYAKQYGPALPTAAHPESAAIVTGLSAAMAREWKDEDVVGGVVASEDWTLVRHRVSGAVLARDVTTVLVVHPKAGAHPDICRAYRVGAKQARTASGWASETTFAGVAGRPVEVPCDVAR